MSKPKRIQRKRTKGWRMPEGVVYVGRPTRWWNDWHMRDASIRGLKDPEKQRAWAVKQYRYDAERWIHSEGSRLYLPDLIAELRGKDLACWCPLDQPCHADVLLELANAPTGSATVDEIKATLGPLAPVAIELLRRMREEPESDAALMDLPPQESK